MKKFFLLFYMKFLGWVPALTLAAAAPPVGHLR